MLHPLQRLASVDFLFFCFGASCGKYSTASFLVANPPLLTRSALSLPLSRGSYPMTFTAIQFPSLRLYTLPVPFPRRADFRWVTACFFPHCGQYTASSGISRLHLIQVNKKHLPIPCKLAQEVVQYSCKGFIRTGLRLAVSALVLAHRGGIFCFRSIRSG